MDNSKEGLRATVIENESTSSERNKAEVHKLIVDAADKLYYAEQSRDSGDVPEPVVTDDKYGLETSGFGV
jgi:hypothetical protein